MAKEQLVRRQHFLDLLDKSTNSLKKGTVSHIAILGQKKVGKTLLVKEHLRSAKDVIPVYVDLSKISLNPENFSVEFIGNVVWSYLKKPAGEFKKYSLIENIISEKSKISPNAFSLVKSVENELLKIKPNQRMVVENAFLFAENLGIETGKKFVIVLDNFENLFDLNNFSAIKNIIELIKFDLKNVNYIATSSSVKQSLIVLKDFECFELKNLDKNEAGIVCESIIGKNEKASSEIFDLVNGHPLATLIVSKRYLETKDAKKAFAIELLQKNNSLHSYCQDSYNYYYSMARGQTLLKSIMKVIASEELRLSQIAKKIYRSAPVTKSIIERLIEADAIYRKDGKFYISDSLLSVWLKLVSNGYELDSYDENAILEAMKEL